MTSELFVADEITTLKLLIATYDGSEQLLNQEMISVEGNIQQRLLKHVTP